MNVGRIGRGVGHSSVSGETRQLTLRDQLTQVVTLRGVTSINHPLHGSIELSSDLARKILDSGVNNSELALMPKRYFS